MTLLPVLEMNSFLNQIGLNSRANLNVPFMAKDIKSATNDDDFNKFVINVAKKREKNFLAGLKDIDYEAKTIEKVVNFF